MFENRSVDKELFLSTVFKDGLHAAFYRFFHYVGLTAYAVFLALLGAVGAMLSTALIFTGPALLIRFLAPSVTVANMVARVDFLNTFLLVAAALVVLLVYLFFVIMLVGGFPRVFLGYWDAGTFSWLKVSVSPRVALRIMGATILFWLALVLGGLFLVVPGVIFWVRFSFFPYFILDQHVGVIESLRMSWRMTQGYFWRLFLLFFVANIASTVITRVWGIFFGASFVHPVLSSLVSVFITIVFGAFSAFAIARAYRFFVPQDMPVLPEHQLSEVSDL